MSIFSPFSLLFLSETECHTPDFSVFPHRPTQKPYIFRPATHTNRMKRLTIFRLSAAFCLCSLFGCSTPIGNGNQTESSDRPEQNSREEIDDIDPDFLINDPTMDELNKKNEPIDSPVWNLSDVDISYVDVNRKLIAFTFDDAPTQGLERIAAVFAAYNEGYPHCPASATIFCNGCRLDGQSHHLLRTCLALGMELGNHTFSHSDLTTLSEAELQAEIDDTDKALQQIDGKPRHLLRAPFGKANNYVKNHAPTPLIDWSIDTNDWQGVSAQAIYDEVFNNKFSGAIVLMHDGYLHTVTALKRLLPDLEKAGYQVVSVSQLAKAHHCNLLRGGVYIRARNQQK